MASLPASRSTISVAEREVYDGGHTKEDIAGGRCSCLAFNDAPDGRFGRIACLTACPLDSRLFAWAHDFPAGRVRIRFSPRLHGFYLRSPKRGPRPLFWVRHDVRSPLRYSPPAVFVYRYTFPCFLLAS